jgi:hypothetical protein
MNVGLLIAGIGMSCLTAWMLISGSAGTTREMWRREDEPIVYWSVLGIGAVAALLLLALSLRR